MRRLHSVLLLVVLLLTRHEVLYGPERSYSTWPLLWRGELCRSAFTSWAGAPSYSIMYEPVLIPHDQREYGQHPNCPDK